MGQKIPGKYTEAGNPYNERKMEGNPRKGQRKEFQEADRGRNPYERTKEVNPRSRQRQETL